MYELKSVDCTFNTEHFGSPQDKKKKPEGEKKVGFSFEIWWNRPFEMVAISAFSTSMFFGSRSSTGQQPHTVLVYISV